MGGSWGHWEGVHTDTGRTCKLLRSSIREHCGKADTLCNSCNSMASCRRLKLVLGIVGFMSFLMVSVYQLDMMKVKTEYNPQLQELRKQQLREMCPSVKEEPLLWNHSIDDLHDKDLTNFLVDDKHGIIYCYIPKVACTNWKRFMIVLKRGEPYQDLMSLDFDLVHFGNQITQLNSFPRTEVKKKLKNYTKFMFVRDPFVRLISAYRDKIQRYQKWYYETYGRLILRLYGNMPNPPQTEEELLAYGVRPSFENFIQYVIDPKTTSLDYHWRQMHKICHPCTIQYDFIGHQETLQDDAEQLLKMLNLENDIKFPPAYQNMTTQDYVLDWFKSVPIEDRRKLYQIYEMDFKLFGYPKPVELLNG